MPKIDGSNFPLNRCPAARSWGYGSVNAMTTNATLSVDESCVKMYFQASGSCVSAVFIGMNAAASLVQFQLPRAIATGDVYANLSAAVQPSWLVLESPSTTVPTFYSNVDTQKVRVMWR